MFGKFLKGFLPGSAEKPGTLNERREHSRIPCSFEIECKQERAEFRVSVQELSPGGLRFTTHNTLAVGVEVLLSFRPQGVPQGRQRIRARVVWVNGNVHGLKFVDSQENMDHSWVYLQLRRLGFDPLRTFKRKARRFQCNLNIEAIDADGKRIGDANLINIGQGGALIHLNSMVPPGKNARLEVSFEGLKLFARVLGTRQQEEGYFINLRFLNHPESAEMKSLEKFLQSLL